MRLSASASRRSASFGSIAHPFNAHKEIPMQDDAAPKNTSLLGAIPPSDPETVQLRKDIVQAGGHFSAVGRVAATWAEFEHEIQLIIWKIADVDFQVGACMTAQIGTSGRLIDCLIALMGLKGADEDHLKALRAFAEKVGNKQRKRNRFLHDPWYFDRDGNEKLKPMRMEITAAKSLVYGPIEENSEKLHEFANKTRLLGAELEEIIFSRPLGPSRETPF